MTEPLKLDADFMAWFDQVLQEMEAREATKQLRKENPWVLYLIRALWPYRGGDSRPYVVERIRKARAAKQLSMPKAFEQTVQATYNAHCAELPVFTGKPEDDLFYSPAGKGSGKWAVHRERALDWLKARGFVSTSE